MTAELICGETRSACICVKAPDHEDPYHQCSCGGSWAYADDGTFIPGLWPGSAVPGLRELMNTPTVLDEEVTGVEPRE